MRWATDPGFSVGVRFLSGVPARNRHYTYQAHGIAYIVDLCTAAIKYKVSKIGNGYSRLMVGIVKWLRPRIVVPIYVGSNPTTHPTRK